MAIDIKFDLVGNPEPPTIILATRNGNKLGQLDVDEESIELVDKFNGASELTFTVHKKTLSPSKNISKSNADVLNSSDDYLLTDSNDIYLIPVDADENDTSNNVFVGDLWDKITNFKLVYCKEWDTWFEITVELDEATESVKTVFCTQLGQAELSQIMLYDIEINTEEDIARDDYKIGVLYDPLDSQSILRRLLEKAPHYSIAKVDNTIKNIQRSFSFDGTSIYDALQDIAEEIGCLFVFNSGSDEKGMPQRTISVYDLQQNCLDCNYRGEFTDKCPKCGSTNIKYGYGDDTLIFVTSDELASEGIQIVADTESVKNCFKLEAGDDLMTATIRNRNPNGTDYIWYFSDATKEDMPNELVEKIESYDEEYQYYYNDYESNLDSSLLNKYDVLVDKYLVYNDELEKINNPIKGFSSLMQAYYNVIDLGWYLKSGLMPTVKMGETDAEEQGLLLQTSLPSLIAVTNLSIVSKATADSTILAMAKAIVNSHYKVAIVDKLSQLVNSQWSGKFVITNYSDEEDTYTTGIISRSLTDWDETYIKQKIDKLLSKENTDDLSITGLFEKEYDDFCNELKKYALTPLTSFHDACYTCIDVLIEQGVGDANNDLYNKLYKPYYNKLKAIEAEMKIRENEINLVTDLQDDIEKIKVQIQDKLNFESYLGKDLWLQFCAYRREDKYSNSNYISDGLSNAELFERALQFIEVAENEIFKSAELQHSISATLNNLLAIPKFKPLVDSFNVGNWIRVLIDNDIYKLRLIEYTISYSDFDNISVEFSDVVKAKNGYSDLKDILSDASSMASSYDSIQRQANLGNEARDMIRQWLDEGLDASLIQIQNNTSEDIVIDNNGLIGRSYSDITEEYSPEQIRLTHNIIAFTDDNWESVKQAIGKHKYKYYDEGKKGFIDTLGYGVSADFVTAGVVSGSQIIGGNIYSDNYSIINSTGSYLNLRDGTFSFGGGALRFDGDKLIIGSDVADTNITELNDEWLKTTTVYAENLNVNAANITGTLNANQINAAGIKVNAADIIGTLSANQINMTGAITWNDLASDSKSAINTAQSAANTANSNASTALSRANTAYNLASDTNSTIDDWSYTYGGTTYIDGTMLMTGTVTASTLEGGEIYLLGNNGYRAASFTLTGANSYSGRKMNINSGATAIVSDYGATYLEGSSSSSPYTAYLELSNNAFFGANVCPPYGNNKGYSIGMSNAKWSDIYATNSVIQTSDRVQKKDINYDLSNYDLIFDGLKPCSFSFVDGHDRRHIGLVSQDVEELLNDCEMSSMELAAFIKTPKTDDSGYDYGLRYGEFTALNTWQIQKSKLKISELEAKIAQLESKLNKLNIE